MAQAIDLVDPPEQVDQKIDSVYAGRAGHGERSSERINHRSLAARHRIGLYPADIRYKVE